MDWFVFWNAVSGIALTAAAIATFLAVFVALRLGRREDQRSLQARYDDARPVLIIVSDPNVVGASTFIPVHQGSQSELDWSKQPHVNVCNVGKGTALNIKSVIYGPEATAIPDAVSGSWSHRSNEKEHHWYHWTTDAVKQGETEQLEYKPRPHGLHILAFKVTHPLRHVFQCYQERALAGIGKRKLRKWAISF
jgi:hypothetical protein